MDIAFSDIFTEIAVLLFLATTFGAIGLRLKQPLIVSIINTNFRNDESIHNQQRSIDTS
jgi:hypothetical protein